LLILGALELRDYLLIPCYLLLRLKKKTIMQLGLQIEAARLSKALVILEKKSKT